MYRSAKHAKELSYVDMRVKSHLIADAKGVSGTTFPLVDTFNGKQIESKLSEVPYFGGGLVALTRTLILIQKTDDI